MRRHFRTRLASDSDTAQLANREWSGFLEEHVSSMLSIQLLGRERRQERTAFRLLAHAACAQMRLFRSGIWFSIFTSLAVVSAMSAVVGYGGWRVTAGTLSVGSLVAFYSFVTQLFEPLSGAAELYARAQRAFSSIRQLRSVLALQPTISEGLHQRIGPDGCQLSGGQRQRLAIARALLRHPRILILDEATSCLDPAAETVILRNLQHCLPSATLIVVSHRLSTVAALDRTLILSAGRIVTDARSDTLISNPAARCGLVSVLSPSGEPSSESAPQGATHA